MNLKSLAGCFIIFFFVIGDIKGQAKKFDTTVKMIDLGFRIECNNKNADQNDVSVSAIGFRSSNAIPTFKVSGKVTKALIDDMNDDGNPDLIICVYNGSETGEVIGIAYNADKNFDPIYLPDIYLDARIREGYKGHDDFSTLTGTLLRKFPVYLPNDPPDKPTGGIRTVQYKAMKENGRLSFKVLRWFDVKA